MVGLPIAIALGALIGKSEYSLEVLRDSNREAVEAGKAYIAENRIQVALKENISEKLYIEVSVQADGNSAVAIISGSHTHFVYLAKDGVVLLDEKNTPIMENETETVELTLKTVYDFATTSPIEELEFINEARKLNENASKRYWGIMAMIWVRH